MACPFFMAVERLENGEWLHAARLPLGGGWSGHCTAPGHEGEVPSQEALREFCNLGYAAECGRLPREREWDSVRFGAKVLRGDERSLGAEWIQVRYICERDHRPARDGFLEFEMSEARWKQKHPDPRVQRMAECFLESWLEKKKLQSVKVAAAS